MRFLRLIIPGSLLVAIYENLILIGASPILPIVEYSSDSAARPLVGRVAPFSAPITDTGKQVLKNRGAAVAGEVGTISQQEQQQPQRPSDPELCTTPMEDDRQPGELGTDNTLYAKSTIAYSRMNDAKTLDAGASSTSVQAVLFSAEGVPSTNVVGAAFSEVVVDITSTFSMTLRPVWGTPSASTTSNVASHNSDISPTTAPHPTRTMATPVTKALADIECPQTRSAASKLRRQAYDDPLYDPAGHPGAPSPPPPSPTPPQQPHDVPPLPHTSCTSSSSTSTSTPQATSMSNPALLDVKPYNPSGSEWIHCVVITTLVAVYCGYRMYRKLRNVRSSLPKSSDSEPCEHADRPAVFSGPGRTWGPEHSRSKEWLRKKRLRAERRLRNAVIHYAQFMALARRTKRAIENSHIRV